MKTIDELELGVLKAEQMLNGEWILIGGELIVSIMEKSYQFFRDQNVLDDRATFISANTHTSGKSSSHLILNSKNAKCLNEWEFSWNITLIFNIFQVKIQVDHNGGEEDDGSNYIDFWRIELSTSLERMVKALTALQLLGHDLKKRSEGKSQILKRYNYITKSWIFNRIDQKIHISSVCR